MIIAFEDFFIPVGKGVGKVEELDLFDKILIGKKSAVLGHLTAFFGMMPRVAEKSFTVYEMNERGGKRHQDYHYRSPRQNRAENHDIAYKTDEC